MAEGCVYMSTNPSALIAVSKPQQGNLLLVDMVTLQSTATIFVITANHRCIAQFDTVPAMVTTLRDHPDRLSRLWGFHLHSQKILIYDARRFTFAPTDAPGQTVHLFPVHHPNEPIFRTMVVEVPLANILSISWEENPVAIVGSTFVPTTVVLKEPDAEYYHDGSSKVKDRYHISIGSPIPGGTDPHAALWKTISDDSGLANFPKDFTSGRELVYLDAPLVLVLVIGTPQVTTITAVNNSRRHYFNRNLEDELEKGGYPWFDVALKMLENATWAFYTLAVSNPIQQPYDYEFVRPIIAVCRYLLTGILRRAGRETQPPTSMNCRTPAWYHKDTEEAKKLKTAQDKGSPLKRKLESEATDGAPPPPTGNLVYSKKHQTWMYTGE